MKVLALIDVAKGADFAKVRELLADELKGSWNLFKEGVLREAYATATPTRVVFILEAASVDAARATLGELPLLRAGLLTVELVELKPFVNWSMLFAERPAG